jgi:hypothetical protein
VAREVDGVINRGAIPEGAYRGLAAENRPRGSRGGLLAVAFGAQVGGISSVPQKGGQIVLVRGKLAGGAVGEDDGVFEVTRGTQLPLSLVNDQ